MKKINIPNFPEIHLRKQHPAKKKILAEVLVGAAVAAGITYSVKKLIDMHHAAEKKIVPKSKRVTKATKKAAKKKAVKRKR